MAADMEEITKLKKIKAIFTDVDGVLTDGKIILGNHPPIYASSPIELKSFHVHDGMAITLAKRCNIIIGFITSRSSEVVNRRAEELHVDYLFQGAKNKAVYIKRICEDKGLTPDEVCFIGDDITDIPAFRIVGFSATVLDAPEEVKSHVDFISLKNGGQGAVRDIIRHIMLAQNVWFQAIDATIAELEGEDT
jgi:YrbI family 3-deoxy-D-manno-octulosonate 8-phosphate phosphatase